VEKSRNRYIIACIIELEKLLIEALKTTIITVKI